MNAATLIAISVAALAIAGIVKAVVGYLVIRSLVEAHTGQQALLSDLLTGALNRQHPFNRQGIDPADPLVPSSSHTAASTNGGPNVG